MAKLIRVPIPERLDMRTIWEHPPLDYYRYGEYPRFIRKPGNQPEPQWEWRRVPASEVGERG